MSCSQLPCCNPHCSIHQPPSFLEVFLPQSCCSSFSIDFLTQVLSALPRGGTAPSAGAVLHSKLLPGWGLSNAGSSPALCQQVIPTGMLFQPGTSLALPPETAQQFVNTNLACLKQVSVGVAARKLHPPLPIAAQSCSGLSRAHNHRVLLPASQLQVYSPAKVPCAPHSPHSAFPPSPPHWISGSD